MRKLLPSLALALLLGPSLAAAEPGTASLDALGHAPLWGSVTVAPGEGRVVHGADEARPTSLGDVPLARVTVRTVEANASGHRETVETFEFAQAGLELAAGSVLVFVPSNAAQAAAWTARVEGPAVDPVQLGEDPRAAGAAAMLAPALGLLPPPAPQDPALPASQATLPPGQEEEHFALLPMAPLVLEGHLAGVLERGGTLRVRHADGEEVFASTSREETRTEGATQVPMVGPVGGRQVPTTVATSIALELPAARLVLPGNAGAPRLATLLVGRGLQVQVEGAAGFADAVGAVRVGDAEQRAQHQHVLLGGSLTLAPRAWSQGQGPGGQPSRGFEPGRPFEAPRFGPPRAQHGVEGDVTYLRIAGGEAQSFAPLVVAGGAAVGLAALLALVPAAKFGATKLLVAPLYTRLKKPEVLEQRRREQLLDAIRAQPGSNATELAQRLGMGWGNLVYHLGVLERERLVSSCREGRHRRFFPAGHVDHHLQPSLALLKNASAARVLDVIRANPGLPQKQLSAQTGLSPSTINWHVERLSEAGLVWRRQEGREVQYYPSDLLQHLDQAEGHVAG